MGKQYNLDLSGADFDEIILNQHGDKIEVSADNARLFDRFANGYDEIIKLSEEMPGVLEVVEKETADKDDISKSVATSRVRVDFCEKCIGIIDSIFGEGTTKKVFRDDYEKEPDFIPDEDLFIAFFEKFTPIMEDIFDRKLKRKEKASKARMAKYQPQDHKKPNKKAYAKAGTAVYATVDDKS